MIPVVPNLKIAQRMEKLGGRCCNCGRNGGRGSYWPKLVPCFVVTSYSTIINSSNWSRWNCKQSRARAAFDLGCEGVQSGTVFSVCAESPVSDQWREAVYQNNNEPTTLALGMPAIRVLNTTHAQEIAQKGLSQADLMRALNEGFITAFRDQDIEKEIIFAGEDVNLITHKQAAAQVVNELAQGLE